MFGLIPSSINLLKGNRAAVLPIVRENIAREANMMTDEAYLYRPLADDFSRHRSVDHSEGEYVRGDVHTNTIEGFFSIFKRGMRGMYRHCGKKHLHCYLAGFDFRYSSRAVLDVSNVVRSDKVLMGMVGKKQTSGRADESAQH